MKIYVASTVHHAPKWKQLRTDWLQHGLKIISRWIDMPDLNDATATLEDFQRGWEQNFDDIAMANLCVTYTEPEDVLRGALVEIGAMLSWGNPVYLVGHRSDVHGTHGSWQFHKHVMHVKDFDDARDQILARYG